MIICWIADAAHLGYALIGGRSTIGRAPTPDTAARIAIGHTKGCISITARTIGQIAGQTRLVHTLPNPGLSTVKIAAASNAGIAIGARITNGRISIAALVGAQLADLTAATHTFAGRTLAVVIISAGGADNTAR